MNPTAPTPAQSAPTTESVAAMFAHLGKKLESMPRIHGEVNLLLAEIRAHEINARIMDIYRIAGEPEETAEHYG